MTYDELREYSAHQTNKLELALCFEDNHPDRAYVIRLTEWRLRWVRKELARLAVEA